MSSALALLAYRYLAWIAPTRCPYPPGELGQLPRQTPPIAFPVLVYSHRGGNLERDSVGRLFTENTLPAFRNSAALGVDLLELDVQLTRDGKAAVFHDHELGRTCGPEFKGKRVADFNYADLPRLLPALEGGSPTGTSQKAHDENLRIPLLEEVFAAHPNMPIQIDLKVPSQQLVGVVNELVTAHGRQHSILWGSFLHSTNSALYAANPGVPLFASAPRALLMLAAHCAGRLQDIHIYESAVIMPWRLPASFWWRPSLLLPSFFRGLNARGVSVVLYSDVNDETVFEACLAAGANALCTDHPSRLIRWLSSRGLGLQGGCASKGTGAAAIATTATTAAGGAVAAADAITTAAGAAEASRAERKGCLSRRPDDVT